MSQPDSTVLIPVGQDLGPEQAGSTDSGYAYRVFDGAEVHELDDDEYGVWSGAAGDLRSVEGAWGPELALRSAQRSGVDDPAGVLEDLAERGLLAEITIGSEDAIRFSVLHRVDARMHILGPSAEVPGGAVIGLPGQALTAVSADCANVFLYGAAYDDLWSVCGAIAEVTPTQQFGRVPKQLMLAELFLMEAPSLLAAGAMCFMRAHLDRTRTLL